MVTQKGKWLTSYMHPLTQLCNFQSLTQVGGVWVAPQKVGSTIYCDTPFRRSRLDVKHNRQNIYFLPPNSKWQIITVNG